MRRWHNDDDENYKNEHNEKIKKVFNSNYIRVLMMTTVSGIKLVFNGLSSLIKPSFC